MDPQKTAVVLVEFQNDFTSDGGALHGAVKDSMESTDMIANTQTAVAAARAAGATIIHAPIQFAEGYGEITSITYDYPMFSKPMSAREFADTIGRAGPDLA